MIKNNDLPQKDQLINHRFTETREKGPNYDFIYMIVQCMWSYTDRQHVEIVTDHKKKWQVKSVEYS